MVYADRDVTAPDARASAQQPLSGIRILEIGGLEIEYSGLMFAGLGADVIKVEPPGGEFTRSIGPFASDSEDPNGSLHYWAHNRGKRSIVLDPESAADRKTMRALATSVDIVLTSSSATGLAAFGLDEQALRSSHPHLVVARMSAFGIDGPWADFVGSDLVHLALGGPMMNCGYDPLPDGTYDLPPIAPQNWHAYMIAGEQLVIGVLAAVWHRARTGRGQLVDCSVHEAVSKSTELDLMSWVMRRAPYFRQTCRHSSEEVSPMSTISNTKDGRWIMTMALGAKDQDKLEAFLIERGMLDTAPAAAVQEESTGRFVPGSLPFDGRAARLQEATARLIRKHTYDNVPWRDAQEAGLLWAPVRRPEENVEDEHWISRGSYAQVDHPELNKSLSYPARRWRSTEPAWEPGRKAPRLDEDRKSILESVTERTPAPDTTEPAAPAAALDTTSGGAVLDGIRVLDFSWFLASAGGTRFISALGAECIKVEWRSNPDTRLGAMAPVGGREARRTATAPLVGLDDPDMGGNFNHKNAGKRGLSLNVRHPDGLDIAKRLVAVSDVVAEGFSAGVLDKWGLGYDVLRSIKPDIIYAQQSGMGVGGVYGKYRAVGPIAAALVGHSEMSGLGGGAMPAGWGYSYLDWIGAYSFAQAILSALVHRQRTGRGQWIDASQCEAGLSHLAVPTLDWQVNGRRYQRTGNRSPHLPAAPHGAYPCRGEDKWIAIACFDDLHWDVLVKTLGAPELADDKRFASLSDRIANQDALDAALAVRTMAWDGYELMQALQLEGAPAGVCQTAGDRIDRDPQLAHLGWLSEVTGTKIGTWPVGEIPFRMSETPPMIGGRSRRGAPAYGEDNEYVLGEILGISSRRIAELVENDVI
jgi:crotonobetainyl-CoA:carnitine CoA-transferase CaiB-like acyl-CoA transferase